MSVRDAMKGDLLMDTYMLVRLFESLCVYVIVCMCGLCNEKKTRGCMFDPIVRCHMYAHTVIRMDP